MGTVDAGLSELTQDHASEPAKWDVKMDGRDIEVCELSSCVNNDDGHCHHGADLGDGACCGLRSACAALVDNVTGQWP